MTPDELRDVLQRLAESCVAIERDLQDSGYPASGGTNLGAAPVGPKSKPPCSVVDLDFIIEDVAPIIHGWSTALQQDGHRTGLPVNQPLHLWCAWLSRHRATLLAMPWAADAVDELATLARQLQERLDPRPASKASDLPAIVTVPYLVECGYKPATIRQWRHRGILVEHGEQYMSSGDTVTLYRFAR